MNLTNKKALITGATGGIGQAITKELLEAGAIVAASGTSEEKLKKLKDELKSGNLHTLACNLSDSAAVQQLVKDAESALDGLDILVCNAGITKDGLAMRMSEEDWDSVIDINLKSSFLLIKSVLRGMMKQRSGRIITIGSVVGTTGNPGQANYVASKAGLAGLVKSIALECASRGITVNNVAPGFIRTSMTDALNEEQQKAILSRIPTAAMGTPEDIAHAVAFLAGEKARYITGQTLHVNGGMVMV